MSIINRKSELIPDFVLYFNNVEYLDKCYPSYTAILHINKL